jgi:hypothetical protein
MTREEFNARGERQQWKCLICGTTPEPDRRRRLTDETPYLEVDHCHTAQLLRDLLCGHCNKGLGLFKDDPALLEIAIAYVRMWQQIHAGNPAVVPSLLIGRGSSAGISP